LLSISKNVKDSNKKEFERVAVWKLDRFLRNRYDAVKYKNVLDRNGVKVISATENINDTPEGFILESVLEGFPEYYLKDLVQKVTRGMTENLFKRKFNGGHLPCGVGVIDGKYAIIEEETILIRKKIMIIFQLIKVSI